MKNWKRALLLLCVVFSTISAPAQQTTYPQHYFRNPLDIRLELVSNFGELRTNHWHMGLDIRTQQRENLRVSAAADGYIARIKIEPEGFGRAIYINHPNGFTTVYAHLNNFFPALELWVKEQQYKLESWKVELQVPPQLFTVKKGDFIAYSGNTGGSQGPHVHFEIRDTKTDNCLNPLLFGFPLPDAVPPSLTRLALYDRNKSVYSQTPQLLALKKSAGIYVPATTESLRVGSNKISFAIGAIDRFTGYANPNGVYCARIFLDDELQSEFVLDNISYDETLFMNAHIDYAYKFRGGPYLQHLSRMPGDTSHVYLPTPTNGLLHLSDEEVHQVRIEVLDAALNESVVRFAVQYAPSLAKAYAEKSPLLVPQQVNVFEAEGFEVFTSEYAVYDTVPLAYTEGTTVTGNAVSPLHSFVSAAIPVHDSIVVRIKPAANKVLGNRDRVVIKGLAGKRTILEKGQWQGEWVAARFRYMGTFQAFVDTLPPVIPPPGTGAVIDLRNKSRISFTPQDNFNEIDSFRAELNGQWLRFTNNKSRTWIYQFDDKFPPGRHELKVMVRDVAGNETTRVWTVLR